MNCPREKVPFSSRTEIKGNPGAIGKGVPLLPQPQMLRQVQKGVEARHGKSQAFNLNVEQTEIVKEMATSTILVYSVLIFIRI